MIFHILERSTWEMARKNRVYAPPSISDEGFIHASTSEQLLGVANFLFAGKSDLLLLVIDPDRLTCPLIFEGPSSRKFPHIYGPLNVDAVLETLDFEAGSNGFEKLPEGLHKHTHQQLSELGFYIGATEDLQEVAVDNSNLDADFGRKLKLSKLEIHHITLRPGRRSADSDLENQHEELILILKGRPDIWIDGSIFESQELDAVAFPTGKNISHCVINNTEEDIEFLVVGERTNSEKRRTNSGKPMDKSIHKEKNERPDFFKNIFEIEFYPPFAYTVAGVKDKELMCPGMPFGRKLGLKKIGIGLEKIEVGTRTSWPHCHLKEDEFGFVISGSPSVWMDGFLHRLNPRDGVAFPAGTGIAHTILNEDSQDAYLIAIGEASPQPPEIDDDRIIYPLHPARNADVKLENCLWEDRPPRKMGKHPGIANPPLRKEFYLETERMKIRPLRDSDFAGMMNLNGDPEVMKYISDGIVSTSEEVRASIARIQFYVSKLKNIGLWAAELKSTREFIGWFCLKPLTDNPYNELGYRLLRKFWGQGLATEGSARIRDYGFDQVGLEIIVAITDPRNAASEKVLSKTGLKKIKQIDDHPVAGSKKKVNYWEITRRASKLH